MYVFLMIEKDLLQLKQAKIILKIQEQLQVQYISIILYFYMFV